MQTVVLTWTFTIMVNENEFMSPGCRAGDEWILWTRWQREGWAQADPSGILNKQNYIKLTDFFLIYCVKYLLLFNKMTWYKIIIPLQPIFDRNRKDELPALQLEWIDGICKPLYQVLWSMKFYCGSHFKDFAIIRGFILKCDYEIHSFASPPRPCWSSTGNWSRWSMK